MNNRTLGLMLGGFTVGLGLAELFAGGAIARRLGVPRHSGVVRAYGARELAAAGALFAAPTAAAPVWARVAGDVLDLATLGATFRARGANKGALLGAVTVVGGALLLDLWAARRMERGRAAQPS